MNRIFSVIFYLVCLAFGILSLLVLGFSLVTTIRFRQYEENDLFDVVRENVPMLLLSMAAVFAVILLIQKAAGRRETRHIHGSSNSNRNESRRSAETGNRRMILKRIAPGGSWPMLAFAGALSLFFVFVIHGNATNDALQLDAIMQEFARGDYSALNPGGYLYVYPFQITYVWIGVGLQVIFGPSNYLAYQILNVVSILLNLYFLYQITWELFGSREVCRVMQVLACGCVFYYVYATFVYADLWSFAVQTAAVYLQILYMKRDKLRYEAGAGVCIVAACLLKSNCYVALIAMAILLVTDGVRKAVRQRSGRIVILRNLILAVIIVAVTLGASSSVNGITARIAGLDSFPKGVPSWNYIAMGMQETEGKYGWYNGTNVGLYREAGWDRDASIAAAKESMAESIGEFRNSGRYALKFYLGKFLSQWGDPTCVSMRELEETERHVEPVYPIAESLIFGTGNRILQWIMNVFHSVIWLGAAVFAGAVLVGAIGLIASGRTKGDSRQNRKTYRTREGRMNCNQNNIGILSGSNDPDMKPQSVWTEELCCGNEGALLLVLLIFGGMLFHELWEASGRYTMRYYLSLLPLAAWGIEWIAEKIMASISRGLKRGHEAAGVQ